MKGDLDSFNHLVNHYQDMVYQHTYTMLGDPDLAEDAAQESFIKTFQNISSYRGGSFRAWLLRIVTNTAYDLIRRSKQHLKQPLFPENEDVGESDTPFWLADPGRSVEETINQNEDMRQVYCVMDELPDVYRSVITLIDLYEMSYAEAASISHVPVGTIKSRLARARLQVKNKLLDIGSIQKMQTHPS